MACYTASVQVLEVDRFVTMLEHWNDCIGIDSCFWVLEYEVQIEFSASSDWMACRVAEGIQSAAVPYGLLSANDVAVMAHLGTV